MTERGPEPGAPNPEESVDLRERLQSLRAELADNWQARELALTSERLDALAPSMTAVDLKNHPTKEAYGLNYLLAIAERDGSIKVDQAEFVRLNDLQQRYVISHEIGHQLDHRLRQIEEPTYQTLLNQVAELPNEQVSYYTAWLAQELGETAEADGRLGKERMAELFGQYLTSDGTFPGMIKMKLLQFNGDHEAWAKVAGMTEVLSQLEEFSPEDEHEQQAFFSDHPELQSHYLIYQSINDLCRNEAIFEQLDQAEGFEDDDHDWLDYEPLVSQMAFKTALPPPNLNLPTKPDKPGFFDFLLPLLKSSLK